MAREIAALPKYISHDQLKIEKQWSLGDDWANSLTHTCGFILSLIGFIYLIQAGLEGGSLWKSVSFIIYGLSLITLYTTSAIYHFLSHSQIKHLFRLLDHCAIYLLIAGSYTPFSLVTLKGPWGWFLFSTIWSLAILGIIFKVFFMGRFIALSTMIYLLMGWLVIIAVEPLISNITIEGFYWIVGGGLFYSIGVIFFMLDRKKFFHAIWHLFVMGGSFCHYFAICLYV